MSRRIAMILTALAISAAAATAVVNNNRSSTTAVPAAQTRVATQGVSTAEQLSAAFEHVAEVIQPSVVSIQSAQRVGQQSPFENSPFRDFFGDMGPRERVQRGLGTGVVVSADGYILTNNHVVGNADQVTVVTPDDRELPARVVGTDPKTDLAVIRIEARNLRPARLGDSDQLRVGEWVIAAGNPFGLSSSISAGIVSAKGRVIGITDYDDFIQTDAAINPGNSGGPLVDLSGQVVGINTAIFSRTGSNMGIGFAIPANMAKNVMQSLISSGRVVRGQIGVRVQDLTEALAESFGYRGTEGAVVGEVTPGSPAASAGIRDGDIITRFGNQQVTGVTSLRTLVAATRPGQQVPVEIFREGRRQIVTVRVGEQEGAPVARSTPASDSDRIGVVARDLTGTNAQQVGLPSSTRGALIVQVEPLSAADNAGLQPNDVVVSVQGETVRSAAELRRALSKHDLQKGVRLGVAGANGRRYVLVRTSGAS